MIINKVITSTQEPDNMERINTITGLNIFDTDNWWLYEIQVGKHNRDDSKYPAVEGSYEKVSDGVYRYKINHNE